MGRGRIPKRIRMGKDREIVGEDDQNITEMH